MSKLLVAGGRLSAAHSGLSPASTFHSDQSTVSKQHPPCKKRRSGSLALSWHPPRIYWLGYKVKDQLTPTFLYRVVFNVPPNFQYQNEKTMGSQSKNLFHEILDVQKILVGWTMFFFLALKFGRNINKSTLYFPFSWSGNKLESILAFRSGTQFFWWCPGSLDL